MGSQAAGLVRRTKECTSLPVAVGLRVRDRRQAAEVAGFADGNVIAGLGVRELGDLLGRTGRAA